MLASCTRTEDGTLLMSQRTVPLRMSSVTDPAHYNSRIRERRAREKAIPQFPASPRVADRRWRPRVINTPRVAPVRVVTPPFKPAQSNKDLTCRNEKTPAGRIKVVCE